MVDQPMPTSGVTMGVWARAFPGAMVQMDALAQILFSFSVLLPLLFFFLR
jgi:hypothetical protein